MDESGSAGVCGGDAELYGYVSNGPTDASDADGLKDAGANGGTVQFGPGVPVPPGTQLGPEGGGRVPFNPGKNPGNVDYILFPGCNGGLLKIRDYSDVTITGFSPTGKPIYKVTYRPGPLFHGPPIWYPAHRPNPFHLPAPGCPHRQREEHTMGRSSGGPAT